MNDIAVLVLNYTYEPLHFTNAKRAVTLLLAGKAESVESSPRVIRSPSVAFNKKNILRRDGYTCQYCSRRGEKLTVDHVMPRSRGGQTTWTNVVAACLRCNLFKGNRTVEESRMRLIREPVHPQFLFSVHLMRHPHATSFLDSWRKYLVSVPTAP